MTGVRGATANLIVVDEATRSVRRITRAQADARRRAIAKVADACRRPVDTLGQALERAAAENA